MLSTMRFLIVILLLIINNIALILSFNIETDYFVVHKGPRHSKFGFSLALQKDTGITWVIVGAPEAESQQEGLDKAGAVYRCHPSLEDDCEIVVFDRSGNHFDGNKYLDDKNNQWFGASIASRGGVLAACAPRYVWHSIKQNRREPIGNCFLISSGQEPTSYSPCMTHAWGYHRQGTCQAGLGLALSKNGNRLYIGAVGSWYWQGQVFYQNLLNRAEKLSTPEGPKDYDMNYMGYSIAVGNFDSDEEEDVAVGVPRGEDLKGKIVLLSHNLGLLYNISGDQIGSYFGYSIAVLDFNGDSLSDIVVGAPWYTPMDEPSMQYEVGKVYCFRHTLQHNFLKNGSLLGHNSRSHFGISVTSLGDINADNYDDLAVGAPRAGLRERGGVYIYLGSASGLLEKPSQILLAEDLTQAPIQTFGWSVTGSYDLDDNEYPDLVVGAHESNKVFVFRTKPVAIVNASIAIRSKSGTFDLDSKSCSLHDGSSVPCSPVQYCLSYTGKNVPAQLVFAVRFRLDTSLIDTTPRLFFLMHQGRSTLNTSVLVEKDVLKCDTFYMFSLPNPQDKLTPLNVELSYSLTTSKEYVDPLDLRAVLAPPKNGYVNMVKDVIYFQNNCGEDNICVPDLSVKASMKEPEFVLGSTSNLYLDIIVENRGDDAYQSKLVVKIPKEVHFSKFSVSSNGSTNDVNPFCTTLLVSNDDQPPQGDMYEDHRHVFCEIGNPFPERSAMVMQLVFQPNPDVRLDPLLKFHVQLNSTNEEKKNNLHNNQFALTLPVVMRSEINLRGISWPDTEFYFNSSNFGQSLLGKGRPIRHEEEAGPEVTHIYDVVNRGPSDLPMVNVYLLWPTRTLAGDPLLYLMEAPSVTPTTVACETTPYVNYLNISVEAHDTLSRPTVLSNSSFLRLESLRKPREVTLPLLSEDSSLPPNNFEKLDELLSCGSTKCSITRCHTSVLKAGDHIFVKVRSRLWVDTIRKLGLTELKISSRLVLHSEDGVGITWNREVRSAIKTRDETPVPSLSWLIWLGSIVAGLLVLAILILLLWMIGFFKRRRPRDETEDELITKNGNTNGRL